MKKQSVNIIFMIFAMLFLTSCGMSGPGSLTKRENTNEAAAANTAKQAEQEGEQSTADIPDLNQTYYLIVKHDTVNYQITLMDLAKAEEICYEYTDGTEFFDKYGNYALSSEFSEGKLAVIERLNSNDTLGAIAFTDDTWDYEDVHNYSVSAAKDRIDIAGTVYQFDTFIKVFSDGAETGISAIGDNDILNIYGIGRKVYAIVIKTGHGMLALTNTELFEGGWVNLGTKVYSKITKDMTMELPEGIYEFSVANDGYGDSGEIRIRRDKTTTIDLNDYKGEGPKMCRVTFDVGVKGAVLTINGKKISYSKPMELKYGVYTLGVYAKGYDEWKKQMVVNSPKANIEILLSEDTGEQTEESSQSASADTQNQDTGTDSSTGTGNSNKTGSNTSKTSKGSRAGSMAGSKAGSYTGSSSSDSSGSNSSGSGNSGDGSLANAALGSSLANIITGGDSTDYLDTLSGLLDSLDKLKRPSSDSDSTGQQE